MTLISSLATMPTLSLKRLQASTRIALSQAGDGQRWSRWADALALLAAVEEELEHRAHQLEEHPTLF